MAFERIVRVNYGSAPSCHTGANAARDFDRFHLSSGRMHNRNLHGTGVAAGLELAAVIGQPGISVRPGLAIDPQGRMIVLADDGLALVGEGRAVSNSPALLPTQADAGRTRLITVEYAEEPSIPVDAANPAGCKQVETRPWFRLRDPASLLDPDAVVILGSASISSDGLVTGVSAGPRQLLGATSGGVRVERATDSANGTDRAVAGSLVPGASGLRLEASSGSLSLAAPGGVAVMGDMTIDQGEGDPLSVGQLARDLADARARLARLEAAVGGLVADDGSLRPAGTIHIPPALQAHSYVVPLWVNMPDNEFIVGSFTTRWRYNGSSLRAFPNKAAVAIIPIQLPARAAISGFSFRLMLGPGILFSPVMPPVDYPLEVQLQECNFGAANQISETIDIIKPGVSFSGDDQVFGGKEFMPAFVTKEGFAYRLRIASGVTQLDPSISLFIHNISISYTTPTVY